MSGTLFVVGTPIGNLADLSPRAREVLASVDVIAAEDTRRTGRLLQGLEIGTRQLSYFEGNERQRTGELVTQMRGGSTVALVTDGGMPSVSDPGYRIVRACVDAGIDVRVVPGPSAAIAALVASGLPTDRFVFEGFLPRAKGERGARLAAFGGEPRTIVLFESPRRVRALLHEVLVTLGDRQAALVREMTKLHEEVIRGSVSEVIARLGDRDPRGEVALVLEGTGGPGGDVPASVEEARELVAGGMRKRDAAREVASRRGVAANVVYRALVD